MYIIIKYWRSHTINPKFSNFGAMTWILSSQSKLPFIWTRLFETQQFVNTVSITSTINVCPTDYLAKWQKCHGHAHHCAHLYDSESTRILFFPWTITYPDWNQRTPPSHFLKKNICFSTYCHFFKTWTVQHDKKKSAKLLKSKNVKTLCNGWIPICLRNDRWKTDQLLHPPKRRDPSEVSVIIEEEWSIHIISVIKEFLQKSFLSWVLGGHPSKVLGCMHHSYSSG